MKCDLCDKECRTNKTKYKQRKVLLNMVTANDGISESDLYNKVKGVKIFKNQGDYDSSILTLEDSCNMIERRNDKVFKVK